MNSAARISRDPMDVDAFLAFIDSRPEIEKWELFDGQPTLMAGGTVDHNVISLNILRYLHGPARARGCRVLMSDVLVRRADKDNFGAFPDVIVHGGPVEGSARTLDDPSIIVEVLSPSTMRFDRSAKFEQYQTMPSVQQIILVYQDQVRVESWTRQPSTDAGTADSWELETLTTLDMALRLPTLATKVEIAHVYEDVALGRPA